MFSRRSSWNLQVNRLTAALQERRRRGERVIDLTLSNPTQAGFAYPAEIGEILARAKGTVYRPEPLGLPIARQAVKGYYAGRGIEVDSERILLTASTSEAYGFLFKLLTDPGDELLVPQPSYPLFEFLAGLEGVETRPYPLHYEEGWKIDIDQLAAAVSPQSRAVLLVHPNNPTGSFIKRGERQAIEELAQECNLTLIVDEVFADYGMGEDAERVESFAGEAGALTFALSGLSKVLGLPQLKLSWILAGGPDPMRREALARLEVIADTYLSVGTPVQEALPELLDIREQIQGQIRTRVRNNLTFLQKRLNGVKEARLLRCEGGWYAVMEAQKDEDEEEWVLQLLLKEGVLVHPGYFFDFSHDRFLVLSLLAEEFAEGIERLAGRIAG